MKKSPMQKVWVLQTDFANCGVQVGIYKTEELAKAQMRRIVFEDFKKDYEFCQTVLGRNLPSFPNSIDGMTDEIVEKFFEWEHDTGDNYYSIFEAPVLTDLETTGE